MKRNVLLLCLVAVIFSVFLFQSSTSEVNELFHPTQKFAIWAFILGGLSAISLPLGSLAGILFNPKPKLTAALTAFGAGALLAALSVELIAPTVEEIVGHLKSPFWVDQSRAHAFTTMGSLVIGCLLGGILFVVLDEAVNSKGGFVRKVSTIISFFKKERGKDVDNMESGEQHVLDNKEVQEEVKEHGGAPMAIWLGLLIDGIPESFVIGAGFLAILSAKIASGVDPSFADAIPYTLIAGLFLSNFPEALSASIGMKKHGLSVTRILMMWMSLVLIIAIGSTVGYYIGAEVPHELEIGIEGLASGAMLTMIAQTMIPEAIHIGGHRVVGLSTLIGYLSAVAFKLFE